MSKLEPGESQSGDHTVFIIHFLLNATIVAVELALVAATGWLAWHNAVYFAGVSMLLAFVIGLNLEIKRLAFEMPFYFARTSRLGQIARALMGSGHAVLKALAAGLVALTIFSGTEPQRLQMVAGIFALCVLAGSILLRRLTISFGARPARWGFFRMGVPLGILFSAAMSFFPPPSSLDVARKVLIDLPGRPGIAQAGEALFSLRLWIDDLIRRLLSGVIGPTWAEIAGIIIGNMLAGFLIAVFAVTVSEVVRIMEETHWRMRGLPVTQP
ncbi:MAG: hypothetical protein R3D67_11060 [Hyphomicrobiaceae bacterium]